MQAKYASLPFGASRNYMFSVPHLIIIFAVALMVFGPEKLPELARTLGKVMGEFRRATGDLRSTFEGHMRELEREAELRRVREAQPPSQTIGGGSPAPALPVSTPEASAGGRVVGRSAAARAWNRFHRAAELLCGARICRNRNSCNLKLASYLWVRRPIKLLLLRVPQHAEPDPDPEKVSDGRTRPA